MPVSFIIVPYEKERKFNLGNEIRKVDIWIKEACYKEKDINKVV